MPSQTCRRGSRERFRRRREEIAWIGALCGPRQAHDLDGGMARGAATNASDLPMLVVESTSSCSSPEKKALPCTESSRSGRGHGSRSSNRRRRSSDVGGGEHPPCSSPEKKAIHQSAAETPSSPSPPSPSFFVFPSA
ncbi:hypothetical protein TIFTF001_019863 [Ficus carica]|uniref:Uncharacterized protein n=1 Tax=Ficus carica TaxID=3494 RepID=A0AA88AF24_FICCA|nr:hypothetical protein TIFTF001_019863 [Ficus carica]